MVIMIIIRCTAYNIIGYSNIIAQIETKYKKKYKS